MCGSFKCEKIERSHLETNRVDICPGDLLCIRCLNGGGDAPCAKEKGLFKLWERFKNNPQTHVTVRTSFDDMGSRTDMYYTQNIYDRKRDIDVCRILGIVPGDTRIARDLFEQINREIKDIEEICGGNGGKWQACPVASTGAFAKGSEGFNKFESTEDMEVRKKASCAEIEKAEVLKVRCHHFLCLFCYIGGFADKGYPPVSDNLMEVWKKINENPDIEVEILEGAGGCMVCPPCAGFDNDYRMCYAGCHLRDRKKDLEVMKRIDVMPGDCLPAKEIIRRVMELDSNFGICHFDKETAYQFKNCGSRETFDKGREIGFFTKLE